SHVVDAVREDESRLITGVEPYTERLPLPDIVFQHHFALHRLECLAVMQQPRLWASRDYAQTEGRLRIHPQQRRVVWVMPVPCLRERLHFVPSIYRNALLELPQRTERALVMRRARMLIKDHVVENPYGPALAVEFGLLQKLLVENPGLLRNRLYL